MIKRKNKNESGQVVLMVLLTMVVALTIALGIFANSLADTALTNSQQTSEKAFSLAEAGIENLLAGNPGTDITAQGFEIDLGSSENKNLNAYINRNAVASVTLTPANPSLTSVNISWTDKGDTDQYKAGCDQGSDGASAGLIIYRWKKVGNLVSVDQYAYAPSNCTMPGFEPSSIGGGDFLSTVNLSISTDDLFLRIRPLFSDALVKVESGVAGQELPIQQYEYESTAKAVDSFETRKIQVVKNVPTLPEVFDYALFSNTTIIK